MNNDDINEYVPSLLNPRTVKKLNGNLTLLTQNSVISHGSLSLKKKNGLSQVTRNLHKNSVLGKENSQTGINLPYSSDKEVTRNKTLEERNFDLSALEKLNPVFSIPKENHPKQTENVTNSCNFRRTRVHHSQKTIEENSIGFSAIEDLNSIGNNIDSSPFSFGNLELPQNRKCEECSDESLTVVSSATDLVEPVVGENNDSTVIYDITEQPVISVSFGITNCETVDISTSNSNIKKIVVTHKDNTTNIDCDMIEDTVISLDSDTDEDMKEKVPITPPKKSNVSVNLEIKNKKLSAEATAENLKVLILNTNAIERLSHVIVQPPNCKLVKRQILDKSKFKDSVKRRKVSAINGKGCDNLKQTRIDSFLNRTAIKVSDKTFVSSDRNEDVVCDDEVMSRNLSASEAGKCDRVVRATVKSSQRENEVSPKSIRLVQRKVESPRCQQIKLSSSEAQRVPSKGRNDSASSHSPRKNVDSLQFSIPTKSKSHRNSLSPRPIPHYKIVAGTHFAVDAFSYGDIANVKHYFLTHFHSDHYSGLKKGFNKFLFCSQITADLCVSRLGVNPKCIHIINIDATITVDGIEVTAVDANHCPGALMLVFTLPNGKTLLHTGDFRASPLMESFPIFWNKDIHTIYLDTTYCNPRYDFPTQDQSLEMALYLLRQKKLALEKAGKKFSSVLIVCGTYTIGKEKFFLGMARRVGCSVWACPEKDRVLQAVEGRSFGRSPPHACQLHVVPMRDLTHEKLRIYLNTLQGAFSEVVAFKPSGWENGKNSSSERDMVTIHGIPYSEHSSFSEMIRFVKFLKPKQVVPTVDISGGIKSVQKYFPCPMVCNNDSTQNKLTDYFSIQLQNQQPSTAVT